MSKSSATRLLISGIVLLFFVSFTSYTEEEKKSQKTLPMPGISVKTFPDKDGALTTANITDHRDLAKYDDGGHFDCRRYGKDWFKDREKAKAIIASSVDGARNFIWTHWQGKKGGYLRITFNTVDATSTSHIFIEPDAKGNWQIIWRIVRGHSMMNHNMSGDVPVIRDVERESSGSSYILVFKSANGTREGTL